MMKKQLKLIAPLLIASILLGACTASPSQPSETPGSAPSEAAKASEASASEAPAELVDIKVGATALPHAEILNMLVDDMKAEGVNLIVQEFGDYTMINAALNEGQIDANFFQHQPYLEDYCANSGNKLVPVVKVHIEPMGVYSSKIKSLSELQDGATVGVPNDSTNEARALLLLEKNGLIKLNEGVTFTATPRDIAENSKNLKFSELDAAVLPRTLSETDISVINTNYALEADLDPTKDALVMEEKDSPYANILVVKEENLNDETVQKLAKALNSEKVKNFLTEKYGGAIVPSF